MQPRDLKIKEANAKLNQGLLSPCQFLRQVVYQSPDVCDGLLAFEDVATNVDEVIEILNEPSSLEPQPQPSQSSGDAPSPYCRICMIEPKMIALQPCGHFCLCRTCLDALIARAMASPGSEREKTKKKLKIECPICRAQVLAHKSVYVYNA